MIDRAKRIVEKEATKDYSCKGADQAMCASRAEDGDAQHSMENGAK